MTEEIQRQQETSVLDRPDTVVRLFLGLPVPESVKSKIRQTAENHFGKYFAQLIPEERWHVTLFFFGNVHNHAQYIGRLSQALPQAFVPTVSVTHLGRGARREQLWAFIQPTPGLLALREALDIRLRKIHFPRPVGNRTFRPHISLAQFYPVVQGMGMADVPCQTAYAVKEAYLYQSTVPHEGPRYSIIATIPF